MHILMGWRNIWRNPRRTLVILAAVVVGVWSMIFLAALMRGVSDQLLENGISTLTGHLQIQQEGYREDPVIQNHIKEPEQVARALKEALPPGALWTERIRVSAIANTARHTQGVTLVGIDPDREARVSFIGEAVQEGDYLVPDDLYGIIVGASLAEDFETRLDRRIVLMSRDTGGEVSSRAFRIRGIFRAELEATEKEFVFITMAAARDMLGLDQGISEAAVLLPSHDLTNDTANKLKRMLDTPPLTIVTWEEMLPLARVSIELYDTFIFVWFLVVFIAMGFGIVNTLLMAVFERIREFGLLKALGMRPLGIVQGVLTESFFLLLLGTAAGSLLGVLSVSLLSETGIDLSAMAAGLEYAGMPRVVYPVLQGGDFLLANATVLFLGILVSLYPAVKAARLIPVKALIHN